MGQVLFIAFFSLAALGLAVMGYATGYYDAVEKMEDQNIEEEEKSIREADVTNRIRRRNRKHKRIDFSLR